MLEVLGAEAVCKFMRTQPGRVFHNYLDEYYCKQEIVYMSWFDEQIRKRKETDQAALEESVIKMTGALMGRHIAGAQDDRLGANDAIEEILKYYHIKTKEIPEDVRETGDINDILEYTMRPYGIMRRTVNLTEKWYRDASGAMIGIRKDDSSVIALIPTGWGGYYYIDRSTGEKVKLRRKNAGNIENEAIAFYKPFPLTKLTMGDLLKYIIRLISIGDIVMLILSMLVVTSVGMLVPRLNNLLFSDVIESGSVRMLLGIGIYMVSVTISRTLFSTVQSMMSTRITLRLSMAVESAAMMRILSLPPSFFREFSAGELSNRSGYIRNLCDKIVDMVLNTGLTAVFSLAYISQIVTYAPSLVLPSIIVTLITLVISITHMIIQLGVTRKSMLAASKESGMTYQLISGIQKIKLSGAENRAFARWGETFSNVVQYIYNPPFFLKISSVITLAVSLIGTIVMYAVAAKNGVSVAEYYAFNSAYGMVNGAFMALAGIAAGVANIKPTLEMAKPIMDAEPEITEDRELITQITGRIELSNITFKYEGNDKKILDNLSLTINPGQYVAVVGKTGCGKSTLLRIMLGFEKPQRGTVYYDGKDIQNIDLRSLRRRIGTVMQNGKLFNGDIFTNISISAPWLGLADAWEAAEIAGIADDIRQMPMGMFTMISEGQGGISGGQRQRLLIARAIAPKPRILMFDEATSALDNLTQKHVSEALDRMKCTRLVIAHRLSTIRQCDRIIMLENGKIVEDGTYEELLAKNGYFAEMVSRQQLNS